MISRRMILAGLTAYPVLASGRILGDDLAPFTAEVFHAAQDAGKPILVVIHASWCSTCAAQRPILSQLIGQPRFKDLVVLRIDFDSQKPELRNFNARKQSTLILFKGP